MIDIGMPFIRIITNKIIAFSGQKIFSDYFNIAIDIQKIQQTGLHVAFWLFYLFLLDREALATLLFVSSSFSSLILRAKSKTIESLVRNRAKALTMGRKLNSIILLSGNFLQSLMVFCNRFFSWANENRKEN